MNILFILEYDNLMLIYIDMKNLVIFKSHNLTGVFCKKQKQNVVFNSDYILIFLLICNLKKK